MLLSRVRSSIRTALAPAFIPFGVGALLWWIATLAISVLAVFQPHRCIASIYRAAAEHWISAEPLYTAGLHGYLYFPTGSLIYLPFLVFPEPVDSHVWRLFLSLCLFLAVRRFAVLTAGERWPLAAGLMLGLAIPAASIDLLRGQMTLLMLALLLFATVDLAEGRLRRGGIWLAVAVFVKPLALVPALLVVAVFPGTRLALVGGLGMGVLFSFIHLHPDYVLSQWEGMVHKLMVAAAPDSGKWFDIGAMLKRFGLIDPSNTLFGWRLAAAVLTLGMAVWCARRLDRSSTAIAILHLGCSYLVLWNPRVEEGSYVMVAVLAAGLAATTPTRWLRWILLGVCVALGTHLYGNTLYRPTAYWIKQTGTLVSLGVLLGIVVRHRSLHFK